MVTKNKKFSKKISDPPQKPNKVEHRYDLNVGQEEKIRMEFSANPKPSVGVWTINGTTVPVSGADTNNMYVSGAFEEKVMYLQLLLLSGFVGIIT